jgi:uracil-xanthine permease
MPGLKALLIGEGGRYDYSSMCIPTTPCSKKEQKANFFPRDEKLPILMAMVMGLQHAFAMVGGLITPPLVVTKFAICGFSRGFCPDLQRYAISAALITSGICSIINVAHIVIPFSEQIFGKKMYLGSGVLSVMGTSFTFLPIFEIAISQMKDNGLEGEEAFGKMLGTSMVCCLLEVIFSFLPIGVIKAVFPPIVSSVTVILIGVALTGTGMKYWGGGVVCAEMIWKEHKFVSDASFPPPFSSCTNGATSMGYGATEYIGLGFSVLCFLIVIELFGSVFMKNCNVILALLFGYFIAAITDKDGDAYVLTDNIKNADAITFLWAETFPLGFYAPAVIPLLIAYLVTTVETVGDISAVFEVSKLDTTSSDYTESIQGGLFADAVNSILSGFFTSMPNTTFSQNNGVIALTNCASVSAGYACGMWLILLGVFAKIAGFFTSIPDCVLGGMTIFLFANVLVSGIALAASQCDLTSRRTRFIFAVSLALGVGVTVFPFAFADQRASPYTAKFWTCSDCSDAMKGVRNGISIFLSTGYCIGTVMAMFLNAILPEDASIEPFEDDDEQKDKASTDGDDVQEENFDDDKA